MMEPDHGSPNGDAPEGHQHLLFSDLVNAKPDEAAVGSRFGDAEPSSSFPLGESHYWLIKTDTIVRSHQVPRTKLYVPKEEDVPIAIEYVDVMRWTETDLDEQAVRCVKDMGS